MSRFATLATLNVGDALPDAWVDEVKVHHDYVTQAGAGLASAASIAITAMFHRVTGTTTITTINDASGAMSGQELFLYFVNGPISIGTSGNIATLTGAASIYAAGDIGHFVYDSTSAKWVENVGGAPLDANQTALQGVAGAFRTGTGATGPGAAVGVYLDSAGFVNISRASNPLTFTQPSDTQYRALFDMNGKVLWGDGSNAGDASVGRADVGLVDVVNTLRTVRADITYSASMTPDPRQGENQRITVTNATAFTINAPSPAPASTRGQWLILEIFNNTAGAIGAATFNAAFIQATAAGTAYAAPAAGKRRLLTYRWNGLNWVGIVFTPDF